MNEISNGMQAGPEISRRGFLAGSTTVAAGAAALGLLGCSGTTSSSSSESSTTTEAVDPNVEAAKWVPDQVDKTYDVDVVVVGTGGSGMTCAMECVDNGLSVLVIDKNSEFGGGTLGGIGAIFGLNSSIVTAAGNYYSAAEVAKTEISSMQYRADGAKWLKFIRESGENIDWLLEKGATFIGAFPNYEGSPACTHICPDGDGRTYIIQPLVERCEEAGVEFLYNTTAVSLIMDGDAVAGLYATNDDGNIQVNAKATVLGTGGWNYNTDLIAQQGWDTDQILLMGLPGYNGEGHYMARAAGARFSMDESAPMTTIAIEAFPGRVWSDPENGNGGWSFMPKQILVNQDCIRFTAEDSTEKNFLLAANPLKENRATYSIFDDAIFTEKYAVTQNMMQEGDPTEAYDQMASALETDNGSVYQCDTIAECAEKFDLDADALQKTVDDYNAMCEAGEDIDFAKSAAYLQKLEAPYYIAKMKVGYLVSLGGVATDINCQAINDDREPIEGLYVSGSEGCTLYRDMYTLNIGGGTMAHAIWSGRTAARHIVETLQG